MKVATITFGYSQNLGALLQAYALAQFIQRLGHDCKIIKYKDFDNRPFETVKGLLDGLSDLIFLPDCKNKIKKINLYRQKYLPFTEKTYYITDDMRELNQQFDVFVAGSDQIWNVHKGVVDEFFLSFVDEQHKKISYGASFGLSMIPNEYREKTAIGINNFDLISVREKTGVELVKQLTGLSCEQVLDPVFLKPKNEWEEFCGPRKLKEKYIFVYPTQITENLTKTVKELKKKTGYRVCSLFYFWGVDKVIKDADPIELVNYIRNAEFVVASSFHATAFSIILNKKLFVIPHSTTGSRVVDLLTDLNMKDCIVLDSQHLNMENIDYEAVNSLLLEKIIASKNFLREAIDV
ncbi:polysaccharide pyruvyl transferase family protein [Clostridium sp. BJN0013]|uniref:polysaccharide pyruvyl transferase family protein n=1 Tax=Clostridium sp. BJN0013 TaxID=3236840 RepID=UPI0034C64A7D